MSSSMKLSLAVATSMLVLFGVLAAASDTPLVREQLSARQWAGTLVMFALLPAYLIAAIGFMRRRTEASLDALELSAPADAFADVRSRLNRLAPGSLVIGLVGLVYGFSQNSYFVWQVFSQGASFEAIDAAFIGAGAVLWVLIALMLSWRLWVSRAIARLGAVLSIDLYRLDKLQPLARIVTLDVLIVAGAMAFMPLQSLDAEFRSGNYIPGFVVGVLAATLLFVLPLWPLHRNIQRRKAERLEVLRKEVDGIPRSSTPELEIALAHLERVSSIVTWPVDLQLLARVLASFVIPPLAWVAAALVENFVDRF